MTSALFHIGTSYCLSGAEVGRAFSTQVLITQSFLILCDPLDCSPPDSTIHGILQARILEWVTIPFSEDLPSPEIEPRCPALQADSLPSEPPGKPLDFH